MDNSQFFPALAVVWVFGFAAVLLIAWHLRSKRRMEKLQIIHAERMKAMEKGIPLPEFPELGENEGGALKALASNLASKRLNPRWPLGVGVLLIMGGPRHGGRDEDVRRGDRDGRWAHPQRALAVRADRCLLGHRDVPLLCLDAYRRGTSPDRGRPGDRGWTTPFGCRPSSARAMRFTSKRLVERHQGMVFRLVLSILGTGHHGAAEELTQDVFVSVYRKLGQFRGEAKSARGSTALPTTMPSTIAITRASRRVTTVRRCSR